MPVLYCPQLKKRHTCVNDVGCHIKCSASIVVNPIQGQALLVDAIEAPCCAVLCASLDSTHDHVCSNCGHHAYQHPVFDIGITCRCYPQLGPVAQRHPGRTPAICSAVTFSLMSTGSPTAATSSGRPWGIPGSLLCPGASGERPWRRARGAVASLHVAQATSRSTSAT